MRNLVERNAIDQDQVVPRPVAAHGEVRELTRRDDARQNVQRTEHVACAAGIAPYLFTLQQHGVRRRPRIPGCRARRDNHFGKHLIAPAHQREFDGSHSAKHDPYIRLHGFQVALLFHLDRIHAFRHVIERKLSGGIGFNRALNPLIAHEVHSGRRYCPSSHRIHDASTNGARRLLLRLGMRRKRRRRAAGIDAAWRVPRTVDRLAPPAPVRQRTCTCHPCRTAMDDKPQETHDLHGEEREPHGDEGIGLHVREVDQRLAHRRATSTVTHSASTTLPCRSWR